MLVTMLGLVMFGTKMTNSMRFFIFLIVRMEGVTLNALVVIHMIQGLIRDIS